MPLNCKPRVLLVNEASCLKTGFGLIGKEFLERLHGDFECAEIGSYARHSYGNSFDTYRDLEYSRSVPWKFYFPYPINPPPDSIEHYNAQHIENQFGRGVFDSVVMDFRPHIVHVVRDIWHDVFIERSVLRDKFKWCYQNCIDSDPIPISWAQTWSQCDLLLSYSAYGKYILEEQLNLPVHGICRCGVDLNIFKPLNKSELREKYNLSDDSIVFGTVCRNQPRKRLARYFDAIQIFLNKYSSDHGNLVEKVYFLLHTSHPDVGIDIPVHIDRAGIGNHVLINYHCKNCNVFRILPYSGETVPCPTCKVSPFTMGFPSTNKGITPQGMAELYGLMDFYVQPSIAGACITKDAQVQTNKGLVNIQDIDPGDMVLSHDGTYNKVTKTMSRLYVGEIYEIHVNGSIIKATPEHPFYVEFEDGKYWIRACNINETSVLCKPGNNNVAIIKIVKKEFSGIVYNLEVEDTHTYTVDGICCHNCEMPIVESKSMGIPPLMPGCAAMAEQCVSIDDFLEYRSNEIPYGEKFTATDSIRDYWGDGYKSGISIPISDYWWDETIDVRRHLFDPKSLADLIFKYAKIVADEPQKYEFMRQECRKTAEKYHDWAKTAEVWKSAINHLVSKIDHDPWEGPPRYLEKPSHSWESLNHLDNETYLEYCYNLIGMPQRIGTADFYKALQALNHGWGVFRPRGGQCQICQDKTYVGDSFIIQGQTFNRKDLWDGMMRIIDVKNMLEKQIHDNKRGTTNGSKTGFPMYKC
jgi:glycosyltransferase involved in cell wall biosynthesis